MRHLNRSVHLNRTKSHRRALFSNLSAQLFVHKRITTTLAKAKYTRQYAERLITFARRGSIADRRHVLKSITNKDVVKTLFDDLGPHFKNRDGGYTRIIKLGSRRGDAAPMAILELVGFDDIALEAPKTKGTSRLKDSQSKAVDEKISDADIASAEEADVSDVEVADASDGGDTAEITETTETVETAESTEDTATEPPDEAEASTDEDKTTETGETDDSSEKESSEKE